MAGEVDRCTGEASTTHWVVNANLPSAAVGVMVLRPVSGLASGLRQRSTFPCSRTVADSDRVYSLTVAGAAPELRNSFAHRLPDSPLADECSKGT